MSDSPYDPLPREQDYVPFTKTDWPLFLGKVFQNKGHIRSEGPDDYDAIFIIGWAGPKGCGQGDRSIAYDKFLSDCEFIDGSPAGKRRPV